MTVIYLGTDSGKVEKLSLTPKTNKVVLISEFVVADTHSPVTRLKFTNTEVRERGSEREGKEPLNYIIIYSTPSRVPLSVTCYGA